MNWEPFHTLKDQVAEAVQSLTSAIPFMRKHRIWKGYFRHGWMATVTLILAALISVKCYMVIGNALEQAAASQGLMTKLGIFVNGLESLSTQVLLSGGYKYLILILVEMVIYHFTTKTHGILTGKHRHLTLNDFIQAQIRMIKVALRSWIYELIFTIFISIAAGIIPIPYLKVVMVGFVQFFFLGVAFIDNYNEQLEKEIKDSFRISYEELGATITIGFVAYVLLMIPVFGPIIAPFVCAIGTTLYMHHFGQREVPLDFLPEPTEEALLSVKQRLHSREEPGQIK